MTRSMTRRWANMEKRIRLTRRWRRNCIASGCCGRGGRRRNKNFSRARSCLSTRAPLRWRESGTNFPKRAKRNAGKSFSSGLRSEKEWRKESDGNDNRQHNRRESGIQIRDFAKESFCGGRRGRVAGGGHGAAPSLNARGVSHGRRSRWRTGGEAQTGLRLFASQPRKNRREHHVSLLDAVHRPARLPLFTNEQLGLCVERGKARRVATARTRGIHPRHHGGIDATGESHVPDWIFIARHGCVGNAADVRVSPAGIDSRPV